MRFALLTATACMAAAFILPAAAADTAQQSAMKTCASTWSGMSAADKAKTKYKDYMSTCMKSPPKAAAAMPAAAPAAPAMAMKPAAMKSAAMKAAPAGGGSAKCKDGQVVTYKTRSGTCSHHGGVATWM
ncbi:MAG TPA: DUF3761 domain-containing protein [Rhizomicrobium sp.]|jgi:hypothetical protein|nr:DUF3761 domain-containing protein [Rhizomicrobium sp.]